MSTEMQWPVAKVRQQFVDYFVEKRGHTFWPGSAVVPLRDPTLLFTNSGMNQFKDLFLGTADPNTDMGKLVRAVNSQPCIRAGGKHNDLEDVGRDTYHHTFFEMLGNWSFGDFFKKEAIEWAWDLLTNVYGLPKERFYATYFEGSEEFGVPMDTEARDLWLQFLPADQVLPGNMKDNFWEMGDVGPCGPCSELHFDRIGGRNAADLVNKDDPMVIEVWNLVFMQFHRKEKGGKLTKLPAGHVDTGMGLERITSILQGVKSNYDTDAWAPLFKAIQDITGYATPYEKETNPDVICAYRAVADHARCLTMAISDGAMPDNQGRGFVLRRIIRRAVRYGVQFLGAKTGFFEQLVPAVIDSLGVFFEYLKDEKNVLKVRTVLRDEEESFAKTWATGLKHFESAKKNAEQAKSKAIDPEDAFILHDRYGFPIDLTVLLAEKEGMSVDTNAFEAVMKKNQTSGGRMQASKTFFDTYQVDELQSRGIPVTTDNAKYTWETIKADCLTVFNKTQGAFLKDDETLAAGDDSIGVVVNNTPFYYECGGQIYDTGVIVFPNGKVEVERVHSFGGYIVHVGKVVEGTITGAAKEVSMEVDYKRRQPIAVNHTMTHQLNHALREVLQYNKPDSFIEVSQRGSYVSESSLRFDFAWNAKLTEQEVKDVEACLSRVIKENLVVYSALVPLEQANKIKSIRQNFEDKYPDPCTVISIGRPVEDLVADPDNEEWKKYSIELCGGTHINKMGQAAKAVVVSEDSLMKGVRRMVVYTGAAADAALKRGADLAAEIAKTEASTELDFDEKQKALSVHAKVVNDSDIPLLVKWDLRDKCDKGIKLVLANKKAEGARMKEAATAFGAAVEASAPLVVVSVPDFGAEREPLQALCDGFLGKNPGSGIFVLGVDSKKDKAMAMAVLSKEAVGKGLSAVEWIKAACGKGGGKPAAAQMGVTAAAAGETAEKAKAAVAAMAAKLA